ncbi:MAG: hypothetical protein U9Q70_07505, partial [Chloroflexota bacterium]|nr:hypothetical protein [Chloroflexota bacterium]
GEYTFEASVEPADATTPSYSWDNGDTSSTRTLSSGTHTLAVTVSNDCSSVTDEHVIEISGVYP